MAESNGNRIPGRTVKLVEIELDRPRKMLFNFNAMMAAEDSLNDYRKIPPENKISVETFIVSALQRESLPPHDVILFLLWASLLHEDPELKPETVRRWDLDRRILIPKLTEAIAAVWPQPKQDDEVDEGGDQARPLEPTDGSSSGLSQG